MCHPIYNIKMNPCGLLNFGNTCYMNTTMQCLVHNPYLRHVLKNIKTTPGGLAQHLQEYVQLYETNTLSPAMQYNMLNKCTLDLGQLLDMRVQNDMQEFYFCFYNKMCEQEGTDCINNIQEAKNKLANASANAASASASAADRFYANMDVHWWQDHKTAYSRFIPIFTGQLVSQCKCEKCNHICQNPEVFTNIDLDLSNASNASNASASNLEDLFEAFFANEHVDEWKCDKCNNQGGNKMLKITRFPKTLVLTLKRFSHTSHHKKTNGVTVPYTLTIPSSAHVYAEQVEYTLYAMGCHQGNQNGGHYYAACKDIDNTWNLINDNSITKLSTNNGISKDEPYMFFYIRK